MRIILKWDKKEKDLIFGESGLVGLGVDQNRKVPGSNPLGTRPDLGT